MPKRLSSHIGWVIVALVAVINVILWAMTALNTHQVEVPPARVAQAAVFTPSPDPSVSSSVSDRPSTPTLTPVAATPTVAALKPLGVTPPAGGKVYVLTPAPDRVGWARQDDKSPNHFGDYVIHAGVYDGQMHVGAIQFDLTSVPPGSPILYADLTLSGLSDQFLASGGTWSVEMLTREMDADWDTLDIGDLSHPAALLTELHPTLASTDLGAGRLNTFVLDATSVKNLEQRTLTGQVSFRIVGPTQGGNNLFSWDTGSGSRSKGQAPVLRLVAGPAPATPPPSPTLNLVIVTSVPTPENVVTAAAQAATATAIATVQGTPTLLPRNWVTPVLVESSPTPANSATAAWNAQIAAAESLLGTPTATALPPNSWTVTPIPLLKPVQSPTPTPPPPPADRIPAELRGKIAFLSDRLGRDTVLLVMDPDGSNVLQATDPWFYFSALDAEPVSPDKTQRAMAQPQRPTGTQLQLLDLESGATRALLTPSRFSLSQPSWSPVAPQLAYITNQDGNDEIYLVNVETARWFRLTNNQEPDRHPSWSPDGSRIVFSSSRETGRDQIWIMNADGSNPRNLSNNEFNDWAPVWIK